MRSALVRSPRPDPDPDPESCISSVTREDSSFAIPLDGDGT